MPLPRMIPDRCALFIVDVQTNLLPDIYEADRMVRRCAFMTRVAVELGLPIVVTEQVRKVFGPTHPSVAEHLPADLPIVEKSRFSGCVGAITARLREIARPDVLVVGMEAHICVLQTTLDLLDRGNGVFLVTDAISSGEPDQIEPAFRRMERGGATPTGAVSAAYELMADAKHPAFKRCLEEVKAVRAHAKSTFTPAPVP